MRRLVKRYSNQSIPKGEKNNLRNKQDDKNWKTCRKVDNNVTTFNLLSLCYFSVLHFVNFYQIKVISF